MNSPAVKAYVRLIVAGSKKYADVDPRYQEAVKASLIEMGREDLLD